MGKSQPREDTAPEQKESQKRHTPRVGCVRERNPRWEMALGADRGIPKELRHEGECGSEKKTKNHTRDVAPGNPQGVPRGKSGGIQGAPGPGEEVERAVLEPKFLCS